MASDSATPFPAALGSRPPLTIPRPAAVVIGIGAALIAVYFLLPLVAQDVLYPAIGLGSATVIVVASRRYPRGIRLAWWLFAAGLVCESLGDIVISWYDLVPEQEPPAPSLADVFYLAGYPLLLAGIVVLLRWHETGRNYEAVIDVAIITVGFALVQWLFLVDPYRHEHSPLGEQLVGGAYPLADVLLIAGFAQLVVRAGRQTWTYRALLASVFLMLVADEFYSASTAGYTSGSWIDALWLASYVLFAAAVFDPAAPDGNVADRRVAPRVSGLRLVLLGAAILAAPAVLLTEMLLGHDVHGVEIAFAGAALSGLVIARFFGLLRGLDRARQDEARARREAEQAKEQLARRNEQLEELDRLKDEFVSLVSHDLRTPLTSISGYVELLLDDPDLDTEAKDHLRVVDRNADRLLHLVDDLLFVAQVQAGAIEIEQQEVDLAVVARECVETLRPRAAAAEVGLALVSEHTVWTRGDARRIAQVLDNLVANAVKFTPAGGHVEVACALDGERAVVEVRDTGIGMSDDDRRRLFERFFRAESAVTRQIQGTGLGLHIAKAIVDAHAGSISVAERPGGGTVFRLELAAA